MNESWLRLINNCVQILKKGITKSLMVIKDLQANLEWKNCCQFILEELFN